jgi:carbamoyl-phosphate synthase large subunit
MPKRTDLQSILILGAGPIVIGQACEFDYSGAQACKALRDEGYRVILVNSNPATIMTDPAMADATYIEPVEWRTVAKIIEVERPDALLPTMGGQTALNCALDLVREGVLEQFGVELIGASQDAIDKAEDRERFDRAMKRIGLDCPRSAIAHSLEEALQVQGQLGFPCIIRPSFTLGGSGGGIAYNQEEFEEICRRGLDLSPTKELLIDESLLGWKEYEMEVVRDKSDNCIIVCSIENLDPMGVHTGDSITVAPAQTLTDKEYQILRNASIAVLREIGVETGGSNVQFAINPEDGRMVVIEMNPRVSRSSALASKATGFPIAKVAAKLAVGYTLDELTNDITGVTPASFEPSIDYVVTKIPRFTFEKFASADARLTTQMKSVGEVMAIGRTFQESLQKALRGLETGRTGLDPLLVSDGEDAKATLQRELAIPGADRVWYVADAFRFGMTLEEVHELSAIDPWFLAEIEDLVRAEQSLAGARLTDLDRERVYRFKRQGFSDARLAALVGAEEDEVRGRRLALDVRPVYRRVDTCAAEFPAATAYLYSTYEEECEAAPSDRRKIMVLGGGPNRIGQGIEFDYCCVHAALAMRDDGFETIMVNCNPETVSTDYDTSDRLYFEPVTLEDVLAIVHVEKPEGVIVQFGGQTPLKLVEALEREGVPIIGTSPDAIDRAEDRERFQGLIDKLGLRQPSNRTAVDEDTGIAGAQAIGFPIVVRPSYVLGGRAMEIVYNEEELKRYLREAVEVSNRSPVLLDRFLDQAVEVDVDAVSDGRDVVIGAIMQHIEQAGVHSGDSACSLPPYRLSASVQDRIREQVKAMALELGVVGLMNVQLAVQDDDIFVLEVNPRASRTVPFVSKCIGVSLAKVAARCMAGKTLAEQGFTREIIPTHINVKESVFPFIKFPGVDPILGPEMKSTGEVMGVGDSFGEAFAKASLGAGVILPQSGRVFLSVKESDKPHVARLGADLAALGFALVATRGTARVLHEAGVDCQVVNKVAQGRPHVVDLLKNEQIDLIVNTTEGHQSIRDSAAIRRLALQNKVCYTTTLTGGEAFCIAIRYSRDHGEVKVRRLQDLHDASID